MELTVSKINNIRFRGKNKNNNSQNDINSNFHNLVKYFKNNADVYLESICSMQDDTTPVLELATYDQERVKSFFDIVTKYIRGQIIKNGRVDFEDEYLTDINNIKSAIECENLTPNAFLELLNISNDKKRNPNLNIFGAIESLSVYEDMKKSGDTPIEDYTILKEDYFFDDSLLLTKNEVDSLNQNSDLFKFAYTRDLRESKSKDEVFHKLESGQLKNTTIAVNYPLIYASYALFLYNKMVGDIMAQKAYESLQENQPELLYDHEFCTNKVNEIEKEFKTKIKPIPNESYIPQIYKDVFEDVYDELAAWKNAGGEEFLCPNEIEVPEPDSDIRKELRSLLVIHNDYKRGWNIKTTNNFGLSDIAAVNKILKERIYENEFKKAGISDELIDKAHKNPIEFISIASRGDFSKYSPEFKQVLIDFGMPEWVFNIK